MPAGPQPRWLCYGTAGFCRPDADLFPECRNSLVPAVIVVKQKKGIPMFIIYIIATILTAAANTYAAIVDFRRPQLVLDNMTKWAATMPNSAAAKSSFLVRALKKFLENVEMRRRQTSGL